jgi:hypothetical protein
LASMGHKRFVWSFPVSISSSLKEKDKKMQGSVYY